MLEAGEDLPLAQEAAQDGVAVHAALDELDDHALRESSLGALGEMDDAHTAAAQLAEKPVGAHPAAGWHNLGGPFEKCDAALAVESVHEVAGVRVCGEQRFDLGAQTRSRAAGRIEKRAALGRRALDGLAEEVGQVLGVRT